MDHYTCDVINLIQLITSERIQQKFTSTKVHAKIWNTVAAELNKMPGTLLTYSGLQGKTKFKNVKAQYMKKLGLSNGAARAVPTPQPFTTGPTTSTWSPTSEGTSR